MTTANAQTAEARIATWLCANRQSFIDGLVTYWRREPDIDERIIGLADDVAWYIERAYSRELRDVPLRDVRWEDVARILLS